MIGYLAEIRAVTVLKCVAENPGRIAEDVARLDEFVWAISTLSGKSQKEILAMGEGEFTKVIDEALGSLRRRAEAKAAWVGALSRDAGVAQ